MAIHYFYTEYIVFDRMPMRNYAKRGPTTCKGLWILNQGKRLKIDVNSEGQPIGENASKLSSFLGTLARNKAFAPIDYTDWRLNLLFL